MARPYTFQAERTQLTVRLPPELERAIDRLRSEMGSCSAEHAALYALRVGLGLLPIARMSVGEHALVPTEVGTVLALSAGPKDAARVERVIEIWESNK